MVNQEDMNNSSYQAALQVTQQAIICLATWLEMSFKHQSVNLSPAVIRAMDILSWKNAEIGTLRLIFDHINLSTTKRKDTPHYCPSISIRDVNPLIPYPQTEAPDLSNLKTEIVAELEKLSVADWSNLSLLSLILEKYGSCLSFGDEDVALVDRVRITGAVAAALAQSNQPKQEQDLSLIAGDLSGIQKFIYTISSEGALKSLRARSFYLELVTEEIIQQFLEKIQLPRTSIIYSGGGKFYLIAPATNQVKEDVVGIANHFNKWLSREFQNKIFLATAYQFFEISTVNNKSFVETAWNPVIKLLNEQKNRKFNDQLSELLKQRSSYDPCKVCHRDDTPNLHQLSDEDDSVLACSTCRSMFELGEKLFGAKFIIRSLHQRAKHDLVLNSIYYELEPSKPKTLEAGETLFLINNWSLEKYQNNNTFPLLIGNYGQRIKDDERSRERFIRALEMAERAEGIQQVGYLRMDVDRLGQIFAKGLDDHYSLPRLAGLSRQMSYFFKVYLNSLAKERKSNFLEHEKLNFKSLTDGDRPNLLFIYAGGDDLFVSGAWNEVVEFAFDVYQSFRAFTGNNLDITLSGGISINDIKFPLYQSADSSGEAESLAKGNGRDSLGLFSTALKWIEWLGSDDCLRSHEEILSIIHKGDESYWEKAKPNTKEPKLLGVLPLVTRIQKQQLQPNYSRNFVRNLLATAQLQERHIEEIEQKRKQPEYDNQVQDLRYYLHLPQIAYTLARLPKEVFKDDDFRKSIKHPYNAPYFRAIATWIELLTRNQ
jgi:CRISPR-associated protein Csm1